MIIKSIQLSNFRNYEKLDISFDSETNIIYGDNAQGKTNILEAAYLSGTTKSHKGSKDKEMIRFGEDEAHIRTIVEKNDKEYRIDMHLRKNGAKGVAINKMPIKKASELFGILNIVFLYLNVKIAFDFSHVCSLLDFIIYYFNIILIGDLATLNHT